MKKEFPQTKEQEKIYDFWRVRGYPVVKAVLGELNVSFHRENPRYEQNGLCFQYLEQFYQQAKEEVFEEIEKIMPNGDNSNPCMKCGSDQCARCGFELLNEWHEIKKRHLSTFDKQKEHNYA
jgi:predicted Zn-ribbon and HTH transcriptional regulator